MLVSKRYLEGSASSPQGRLLCKLSILKELFAHTYGPVSRDPLELVGPERCGMGESPRPGKLLPRSL